VLSAIIAPSGSGPLATYAVVRIGQAEGVIVVSVVMLRAALLSWLRIAERSSPGWASKARWSSSAQRSEGERERAIVTDFILVPGAGGVATPHWRLVTARLEHAGHRAFPVDLPGSDPEKGLPDYAAMIVDVMEGCAEPVVVAQSMGGFSAVMACHRVPAAGLILVNAMVPAPGETPGEWWAATGAIDARVADADAGGYGSEFDLTTYFLHDLDSQAAADVLSDPGEEADIAFGQPCEIEAWPDVPTTAVVGRDDRFFPLEFQRKVLRERVGVFPIVIPGGHLLALANPNDLFHVLVHLTES
jgi:pimeloyl-ACP methyl ester carboxylesterase